MRHQKNRSPELVELCARMSRWREEAGAGLGGACVVTMYRRD